MIISTLSKRVFSFALMSAIAVSLVLFGGNTAFANNCIDKYYAISSSGHGYTWTSSEYKEDTTSSWNDCRSASGNHNAQIGAQSSYNGTVNFVSPKYAWRAGKAGYMINNVKERGYTWATLWIDGSSYVWANGYWSPDSV